MMVMLITSTTTWLDSIEHLAWAQRITLTLLFVSGFLNLYLATRSWIEPLWRRSYVYKGSVCLLSAVWYMLLVFEVIGAGQFVQVTRWIQPCLIMALLITALQHLSERRKLQRRLELRTHLVQQAERIIDADEEKGPP